MGPNRETHVNPKPQRRRERREKARNLRCAPLRPVRLCGSISQAVNNVRTHLQRPPRSRQAAGRHRRLRPQLRHHQPGGVQHRPALPDRYAGLRAGSPLLPRVHQAAGPDRAGDGRAQWREGPGDAVPARPGPGCLQYRRHDPVARLQRYLAGGRMGPSVRQPRGHPRHGRLAVAHGCGRRQAAPGPARRAHRDDQGPRDPGRDGIGEQLQSRRPRPCGAGQAGQHRGGHADAGWRAGRDHQRSLAGLGRWAVLAHLPACPQYRLTQVLGCRGCHQPRGAPGAHHHERRDGLPLGPERQDLGLLRRAVQGQPVQVPAAVRLVCHGERSVQDLLPGGVSRADCGRVRHAAAPASQGSPGPDPEDRHPHPRVGHSHHRQEGAARTIPPTATTASSTWSRCP